MKIGIICALEYEAKLLIAKLENAKQKSVSNITFTQGNIAKNEVVVAICGVGKVFAAICAQTMILEFKPDIVINSGVAGGIAKNLKCGDIAVATSVVQHDMDTSPLGDPLGLISGINVINFECDKLCSKGIAECAKLAGANVLQGVIASGDKFVASHAQKEFIEKNFNAVACDMEAGAIGHTCFVSNVPFCVIRAISDSADGSAHLDYPTFSKIAADNAAKILESYIINIDK